MTLSKKKSGNIESLKKSLVCAKTTRLSQEVCPATIFADETGRLKENENVDKAGTTVENGQIGKLE